MPLLGRAALAMWWNMAKENRKDFEDWHSHEHFPERLGIPGFRRGSRWSHAGGGEGVFVMYELEDHQVLSSPAYLARLNSPTPWSARLMPHHKEMVRSQSHIVESRGGGVARHALTLRLSPQAGAEASLGASLASLIGSLVTRPGLTGAHLLRHETPAIPQTTEQKMRGAADQTADWVVVACGYDRAVMEDLSTGELGPASLDQLGAAPRMVGELYTLSFSAVPADVS